MRRWLFTLVAFTVVSSAYMQGWLAPIDRAVSDWTFYLTFRNPTGLAVIVEVDDKSVKQLGSLPLARTHHAKVLKKLIAAGAWRVGFDTDFSSRTTAAHDGALAAAIRDADGKVVLPLLEPRTRTGGNRRPPALIGPIGTLARKAKLGSMTFDRDPDGSVRRYSTFDSWRGKTVPSFAVRLASDPRMSRSEFRIDFGIRAARIPRLSFVDVLRGRFDPSKLSGKVIIIGTTATGIGARYPVPVSDGLPGAVVQALAYESIIRGRKLYHPDWWLILPVALLIAAVLSQFYATSSWRRGLVIGLCFIPGSAATAVILQWIFPLSLDIAAWWAAAALSYLIHFIPIPDQMGETTSAGYQTLVKRRAMLDSVVDDSADGIIITDVGGIIQLFNPMASHLLGVFANSATARPIASVVPEFSGLIPGELGVSNSNPLEPGVPHELQVVGRAGETFSAELILSSSQLRTVSSDGTDRSSSSLVHVFTFRDITERKRVETAERKAMEEAIAASRAKSEFLANVSHELRTPLNAIIGFSEMMIARTFGPLGADQYEGYVKDIHNSGAHLLEVINDILDMSKIEAGEMKLQVQKVDMEAVVDACLRLIGERAHTSGLTVAARMPPDLPQLHADQRLVKQMLLNLLSNAVKFTPPEGTVTVECGIGEDGTFNLSVADTGIGIAPRDIDRVLAPFGQVDASLERTYEGTGLGLPLVKSMVELHGGTLSLESTPNAGTTVTISFTPDRVVAPTSPSEKDSEEAAEPATVAG